MESLIPVINRLQDVFSTIGMGMDAIDLPQIVVVGSQSSGKSSVLENIVGKDFLPRGTGIVTRRPLVLQLINSRETKKGASEWGEFLHKPNKVYTNFANIRNEIARETDRMTGNNKGISNNPINLRVHSPHVLNLTLVDLPGMTRVPVGDQPSDIEHQIRNMILQYITKPNAIILAVTAANTDLANSDSLHLAREVDPSGVRTIGVITKIDIMDQGTDALDLLMGRIIPLRLGYIGVINRSQKDITTGKSIRDALKSEAQYFNSHPRYRTVANRNGTPFLSKTLNQLLMVHIRNCLPDLKAKINKMLAETQTEMMTYGNPLYEGHSKGALLLQILTRFSNDFQNIIDGRSSDRSVQEIYGGARINYIFTEVFTRTLNEMDPNDGMTANDIRTVIKNATGPRAALFVPEAAFDLLVKRQIKKLEDPSLQCVELVFDELQRIVNKLESKELLRFTNLRTHVVEVVNNLLHKCKTPTKIMIGNIISIELTYVNTNHPDFVGGGGAMSTIIQGMNQSQNIMQQPNQMGVQAAPMTAEQQLLQQQSQQWDAAAASNSEKKKRESRRKKEKAPRSVAPQQPQGGGAFFGMFGFSGQQGQGQGQPGQGFQQQPNQPKRKEKRKKSRNSGRMQTTPASMLPRVPVTLKADFTPSDKEKFETELIQNLLVSYFNIVRKNVQDAVPKSIMHFLVNQAKDSIQSELVSKLYKEELFGELLEEAPDVEARRNTCQKKLTVLRKAQEILSEVRDISF